MHCGTPIETLLPHNWFCIHRNLLDLRHFFTTKFIVWAFNARTDSMEPLNIVVYKYCHVKQTCILWVMGYQGSKNQIFRFTIKPKKIYLYSHKLDLSKIIPDCFFNVQYNNCSRATVLWTLCCLADSCINQSASTLFPNLYCLWNIVHCRVLVCMWEMYHWTWIHFQQSIFSLSGHATKSSAEQLLLKKKKSFFSIE